MISKGKNIPMKLNQCRPFSCRYNMRPVEEGLGGGRCAAPSRHGQKGGVWRDDRYGDDGRRLLLHRADDGGGVGLRDTEPLGEGREGMGRGIAEGAQSR